MWRMAGRAGLGLLLIAGFICLGAMLHVRSAIDGGALGAGTPSCLTERDLAAMNAGPDTRLADWWIVRRVYEFHVDDDRGPGLGWRGAFAELGTRLSMSPDERVALAYPAMARLPVCR